MLLTLNSRGDVVRQIQAALGIQVDGIYGRLTQAAVKNFQLKNDLPGSGEVNDATFEKLLGLSITTDSSERVIKEGDLIINEYFLDPDEYVRETTPKFYLFLHHTAGWADPFDQVRQWNGDSRGRIGTEYLVGGRGLSESSPSNNFHEGVIIRAIPNNCWAYHLGAVNPYMHKHSIGIEICNFGYLQKMGSHYYTYTGKEVHSSNVIDLGFEFKGYRFWHNYTDKQLSSLFNIIYHVIDTHKIDYKAGLKQWISSYPDPNLAFQLHLPAQRGEVKGILSHTNVNPEKYDIYPHPKILEFFRNL